MLEFWMIFVSGMMVGVALIWLIASISDVIHEKKRNEKRAKKRRKP